MPHHGVIAVISTSCRLPDANSPAQLWANVLEGRRSFRALPKERLDISRYAVNAVGEADSITPIRAGLLTNWKVDRGRFRIPQKTYETTDLTHWLALEVAAEGIAAAGGIERLDRTRTAVVVANTLAGEFSRTAPRRKSPSRVCGEASGKLSRSERRQPCGWACEHHRGANCELLRSSRRRLLR
jgi:enediyne polyketide synthase